MPVVRCILKMIGFFVGMTVVTLVIVGFLVQPRLDRKYGPKLDEIAPPETRFDDIPLLAASREPGNRKAASVSIERMYILVEMSLERAQWTWTIYAIVTVVVALVWYANGTTDAAQNAKGDGPRTRTSRLPVDS